MRKVIILFTTIILSIFVISCGTSRPAINIKVVQGYNFSIGYSDYIAGFSKGLVDKIQSEYKVNVIPRIESDTKLINKFDNNHYKILLDKYCLANECNIIGDQEKICNELKKSSNGITNSNAIIVLIVDLRNNENEIYTDEFEFYCTSDYGILRLLLNSRNWMSNINSYIGANAMSDLLVGVKGHSYTQEAIDESVTSARKAQFMIGVDDEKASSLF